MTRRKGRAKGGWGSAGPNWGVAGGTENTPGSRALFEKAQYDQKWRTFFLRLALGRFKWEGLPDSVDERYLEKTLLLESRSIFFLLNGELTSSKVVTQDAPDRQENYHKYRAVGANGWTYNIPDDQGVIMWDSMGRMPTWPLIELGIDELTEIDMSKRVNTRQQRNAVTFSGPAEAAGDLAKLVRGLEMGETQFVTTKNFNKAIEVQAIRTGVEYMQDKFHQDKTATLNSIYLMLGIDHVPFEKKAHLLEGEADKSTDAVMRVRDDLLQSRRQAAEQISELFGTEISVEWNENEEAKGDEENGDQEV